MNNLVSKILVVAPEGVADSLLFLPAVAAIRRHFVPAELHLLAEAGICALHESHPLFEARLAWPGGPPWRRAGFFRALRAQSFDLALLFRPGPGPRWGAVLAGARERVGRAGFPGRLLLTQALPPDAAGPGTHRGQAFLEFASALGARAGAADLASGLALTQAGAEEQARLFRENGLREDAALVALCPSAADRPSRCWPIPSFARLAGLLSERRFQVALFGPPSEKRALEETARLAGLPLPQIQPGLRGLAACLSKVKAVVANDSGLLHLAAAAGGRVVGLYGPEAPAESLPRGFRAKAMYLSLDCSPCRAQTCPLRHHRCLEDLRPEDVLEGVLEVLKT